MEELRKLDKIVLVYEALWKDLIYQFPQLECSLLKDLEYIRRSAQQRGIQFFLLDLPAIDKLLIRGLDEKKFPPSGLAHTCALRHGSNTIPIFLGGLYELIFMEGGRLKDDYDAEAIRALRQVYLAFKKLPQPFSDEALRISIRSLVEDDTVLPKPERFWEEDAPSDCIARTTYKGFGPSRWYSAKLAECDPDGSVEVVLANLDIVSRLVSTALGVYRPHEWSFKHGPGAISQVSGPSNKYTWYGWTDALESVYPLADCGFHSYSAWAHESEIEWRCEDTWPDEWIDKEDKFPNRSEVYLPSSRLVAVPKTYEKPRLIAAEPSEHQWCQQNLWHYIRVRTRSSWLGKFVRFGDQTRNQELCRLGSLDGSLATLDLSSASDRVSCHAVGNYFRCNLHLLQALRASRTRFLTQTLSDEFPRTITLNKFSTMGSACTFPVQSLLFLGIALSAALADRGWEPTLDNILLLSENVAVFGDDIIVPSTSRELLQKTLEVLDFKVNETKSFSKGNFRESCGVDYIGGAYVTPIYCRTLAADTPEEVACTVDTANNYYYSFYLRTAEYIGSTAPCGIATVKADSGAFGFRSRLGLPNRGPDALHAPEIDRPGGPLRWSTSLHRTEARILTLQSSQGVDPIEDDSALHMFFTEQPDPLSKWCSGVRQRPKLRLKFRWVDAVDILS